MLSGATGSLGLGGGVGGSGGAGYGNAASSATSSLNTGPISISTGDVSSGGVNIAPTIRIAFPDAELSDSADINPPLSVYVKKNFALLAIVGAVIVGLIFLFRS